MTAETAWLIERNDPLLPDYTRILYYAEWMKGQHYWTPDHMKAKRFPDEAAARAETNGDPLLRVAEHKWIGGITPPEGGERANLIARIEYILDMTASAKERLHRRAHLTNHDLRMCIAALSTPEASEDNGNG